MVTGPAQAVNAEVWDFSQEVKAAPKQAGGGTNWLELAILFEARSGVALEQLYALGRPALAQRLTLARLLGLFRQEIRQALTAWPGHPV
eukprot:5276298-Alexandrium_andersonii.AAC.1